MAEGEEWRARARRELGREPEASRGLDGVPRHLLSTAADAPDPGLPGLPPYTRGIRASMYAGRPWTIRQYAGFSTAEDSNAFYRQALASGQQGISVAFDLATHRGYDSDHPRVEGDVGMAGVAIDSADDMARLLDGIPLDRVSVSMTMNGAVVPVMACFIVAGEEQGVAPEALSGTIQNDILKEFITRNTYIHPPGPSLRIVADVIAYAARRMPRFNSISISGYHMQEAGADLVQELAFTLADGREYVRAALARGLDVDAFAPRLSFFFAVGMDLFAEAAKLRAARLLWHRVMAGFGAKRPESLMLRTHCQTSGVSLQAQDPLLNVVRTAYEALAAVLGGTQSLHTNSYDEALALPSDAAARVARGTQLILQEEMGLTGVVDPLGGSFHVERLTRDLADAAWALMEEVEALGGMAEAVAQGMPKARIEATAARRQAMLDSGETAIVGVNKWRPPDQPPLDVRVIDNAAVRAAQVARLQHLKGTRDQAAVDRALSALTEAARAGGNLLEAAIPAARARATVGEMTAALEAAFGRHEAPPRPPGGAYGAAASGAPAFESARAAVAARPRPPRMLVVKLGQDGHDRGARVVATAFADLGFDVAVGPLFQTPEEAAEEAARRDPDVVGLSSLAAGHLALAPRLVDALRARGVTAPVIVGGVVPPQHHAALHAAGVSAVFGPGTPIPEAARAVLALLEPA